MTTGKTIALTIWTFVSKVMCLLFNILSRFVIAFLPRSKHLLISWLQSQSAVILCVCVYAQLLQPKKIKSGTVSIFFFPIFLPWNDGTGYHDLSFFECWILSQLFHSPLSPLFSSSLLSAIRVLSSAYLRLLIFLPAILIPACDSSQIKPHWPCWNHFRFVSKKSIPFLQRKETEIVKYMYIFDYLYIYIYIYIYI